MKACACQVCGVQFLATAVTQPDEADPLCPVCQRHQLLPGQELGLVLWFQPRKGYGFVRLATGERIFCHGSRLQNTRRLHKGDLVRLQVRQGPQGAEGVDVIRLATRKQLARMEETLWPAPEPE